MSASAQNPSASTWNRSLVEAESTNDDLTFEEYARRYNFENTSNRSRIFTRLIIKECLKRPKPVRVLDIGCGKGIELYTDLQWAIREHATEYWGVEPDPSIPPTPGLFDEWRTALMEDAGLPVGFFDIAYSFMVMEHVVDPTAFMSAVMRCLKPGGVYIFATPNRRHYFTRIASTLHRLGLDEFVLRAAVGTKKVVEYHYPVQYRFNDEKRIGRTATVLGCPTPEYVYLEERGPIGYFPKPTRFIYHALRLKRRLIQRRSSLITMICRMRKA